MLAGVSLWLTEIDYKVSVIGRSKQKHCHLVEKAADPYLFHNLIVDYHNHSLLEEQVRKSIRQNGAISLVVSWTPSLQSLEIVNRIVSEQNNDWKLYQVKGSRRYFNDDNLHVPSNCTHSSIYLGFIIEGNQSRWLTNDEIVEGVIKSVQEDNSESIIGRLYPYERRPD
ncbi:short-chain dehydrogenase [Halobacillus shinanisalinarum]|uniref:Short-chain dehydrogenase n=1 Tax=Halobacillus shinanisalinarum TaxID=2932258 RepID=A0ABY4H6V3_9BACI|nr:short-chain dehydrogenase [Halobacillus shinanisalinarum]UOQ94717.1 short-chain dehydrogenase [Halobacillus shinanisalinarum]